MVAVELPVASSLNGTAEAAASVKYAASMRIFQVALLPEYANVTVPQTNLTPSIPWSVPSSATTPSLSAFCYYHARQVIEAHGVPVGVVASSWGGTAIQPWMTPEALTKCPGDPLGAPPASALGVTDPGLRAGGVPTLQSTLWNAMLAPLLPLKPTAFLWYQGESNAGRPVQYACLFPAMIQQWRDSWNTPAVPFIFAQIAPWPDHNIGIIASLRYAQRAALALPVVGMVVTADIGDPSGGNHPIHPPWKQEVARRSALIGEALVFKNASVSPTGPMVVRAKWDAFDPSWGTFHFGSNPHGSFCATAHTKGWHCGGIQVTFDRAVTLSNIQCTAQAFSQGASRGGCGALGSSGGFELWNNVSGNATAHPGTVGPTGETLVSPLCTDCSGCPCTAPAEVWGILPGSGERTVQLNVTWVLGSLKTLKYGWADYPSMSVFSKADGRPAAPFNVTLEGL